jgi:hypothetical protein
MTAPLEAQHLLLALNQAYIDAFLRCDVAWYDAHLGDDFVCIESDGTVHDKASFLVDAAKPTRVERYVLAEVHVRLLGAARDVAQVRARGDFTRSDGSRGTSFYIDTWALRGGEWLAVSAQITRAGGTTLPTMPAHQQ